MKQKKGLPAIEHAAKTWFFMMSITGGITIDTTLRDYYETHKMEIMEIFIERMPLIKFFPLVSDVQDKYTADVIEVSELLQSYQDNFTPKGGIAIRPEINTIFDLKIDTSFILKKIEKTYQGHLKTSKSNPYDLPLERFIIDKLLKKAAEELPYAQVFGKYVAPTEGVANASVESMDGLLEKLKQLITATKVTPNVLGAIGDDDDDNIVTHVNAMWAYLPVDKKFSNMRMYLAEELLKAYFDKLEDLKGRNIDYKAGETTIKFTNTQIIGLPMGASQRIFITHPDNIIIMEDGSDEDQKFIIERTERKTNIMFDFKSGVGFRIAGNAGSSKNDQFIWCNDQE